VKLHSILIAEDNPELRRALKIGLEAKGYAVRIASNGAQALALQDAEPADVLVTDLFMPEADGFDAIRGFQERFPRTPIIAISGEAKVVKSDMLAAAALAGVHATIRKPFKMADLLRTLTDLEAS